VYAADSDRERVAGALREHYVRGRLTADELADRVELVVRSRSRRELRAALSGLPMHPDGLAAQGRSVAQAVLRGAVLVVFTGAYLVFTIALLLVLAVTAIVQGATGSALVVFLLVWLVPTLLLYRLWHRKAPQRLSM
jgi:hypothetical protein